MNTGEHKNSPHLVILDMDGVVTAERGYWDAAICTVVEYLAGCGLTWAQKLLPEALKNPAASRDILDNGLITEIKNRSINTNWDLAFMGVAWHLIDWLTACKRSNATAWEKICDTNYSLESLRYLPADSHFQSTRFVAAEFFKSANNKSGFELIAHLEEWAFEKLAIRLSWLERSGELWNQCFALFQHSYLGTELAAKDGFVAASAIKRRGIVFDEPLVIGSDAICNTLSALSKKYTLGIATGRCLAELEIPLKANSLTLFFDPARIVTHDNIAAAEKELQGIGHPFALSKPHPFGFLKAIYPEAQTVALAKLEPEFLQNPQTVIVGDTVGDIRAAEKIHAISVAVLTGVAGEKGRIKLIEAGAQHVIRDISELPALLQTLFKS